MNLLTIMESITLLSIVKAMIIVLLIVYLIFAYLMMRQIGAMTRAITMKDDFLIRWFGAIHFLAAILVTLLALLVL